MRLYSGILLAFRTMLDTLQCIFGQMHHPYNNEDLHCYFLYLAYVNGKGIVCKYGPMIQMPCKLSTSKQIAHCASLEMPSLLGQGHVDSYVGNVLLALSSSPLALSRTIIGLGY